MPFVETYAVNLAHGNLHPHINLLQWPDLERVVTPMDALSVHSSDSVGLTLKVARGQTQSAHVFHSLVLLPPADHRVIAEPFSHSIPIATRFLTCVTFDRPNAESLPPPTAEEPNVAARLVGGLVPLETPEPWAIALNISPDASIPSNPENAMVNVTCQFNRNANGIRLNAPGAVQTDQSANLESPLNYDLYQDPAIFTLKHSFVGSHLNPAPGVGSLRITRQSAPDAKDHRVYSSTALLNASHPVGSIEALGVSLVTQTGVGWISVRLRSFSVWCNPGLPIAGVVAI